MSSKLLEKAGAAVDPLLNEATQLPHADSFGLSLRTPFLDGAEHRIAFARIFAPLDRSGNLGREFDRKVQQDAVTAHHPTLPSRRNRDQLLRLDREFHRQLLQHVAHEAVDDQRRRLLRREAALHGVEELILGDLRGRRLMLELRARSSSISI